MNGLMFCVTLGAGVLLIAAVVAAQVFLPNRLGPDRAARRRVKDQLARRSRISDAEWAAEVEGAPLPVTFVGWFRRSASRAFGFDLGAALPSDRLIEDLGLYTATCADSEMDVDSEVEFGFDVVTPDGSARRKAVKPIGEWATYYWEHIRQQHPGATGDPTPRKPWWRRRRGAGSKAIRRTEAGDLPKSHQDVSGVAASSFRTSTISCVMCSGLSEESRPR